VRPLDPRLLRYARATGRYVSATAAIGVGSALLVIVQAGLLSSAISAAFLEGAGLPALRGVLVALAAVVAARVVLAWVQEAAAHRASAAVKSSLRSRLVAHSVSLGPVWLSGQRSGELTALATRGVDALDGYFAKYLPQLVLAVVVPVAVLATIVTQDWVATVTIVLTLPLIPVFMVLVGSTTRARTAAQWRTLTVLGHHFLDVVAGLPTLKVFGRARAQAQSIRSVTDDYRRASMSTLRVAFLSALVLELLATLSVALVAVGIGLRLVEGELDLRTGLLVLILAPEAYLPLRMVGVHYHASAEGVEAAQRVFEVLEQPLPRAAGGRPAPDPAVVALRGVAVTYPGREQPAVSGVDLELRRGEVLALAGPSGGGKSSLVAVLLGFVAPSEGRVEVTDAAGGVHDLADVDLDSWRARLGWAPQRPHLFSASLAGNVRLARPQADDDAVREALREAAADDVLADLDLGAPLGEGGHGLSTGQRRRVALARALLRTDAAVLVLDEPTADLDAATEARVVATLRARARAGAAVLLVAHRPGLLAVADRVVTVGTVPPDVAAAPPLPPVTPVGFGAGL
jgi:thiol reductant ABC exporter CydD subunit